MPFRLIQISDMHLSRTHPFFFHNWDVVVENVNARRPDMIVLTGDLSANGPDRADDLAFAGEQIARLEAPVVLSVPGNHDVGETPPQEAGHQPVDEERRKAYLDHVGPDYWSHSHQGWHFLGVNSYLFGSGLAAEVQQEEFVAKFIEAAKDSRVGVFLHTPFYLNSTEEADNNTAVIRPQYRKAWLDMFRDHGNVAFVGSGHLHQYKLMEHDGVRHIWAPATAMISSDPVRDKERGGVSRVGYLDYLIDGANFTVDFVEPAELINHDTANWAKRAGGHAYYDMVALPYRMPVPAQTKALADA